MTYDEAVTILEQASLPGSESDISKVAEFMNELGELNTAEDDRKVMGLWVTAQRRGEVDILFHLHPHIEKLMVRVAFRDQA